MIAILYICDSFVPNKSLWTTLKQSKCWDCSPLSGWHTGRLSSPRTFGAPDLLETKHGGAPMARQTKVVPSFACFSSWPVRSAMKPASAICRFFFSLKSTRTLALSPFCETGWTLIENYITPAGSRHCKGCLGPRGEFGREECQRVPLPYACRL